MSKEKFTGLHVENKVDQLIGHAEHLVNNIKKSLVGIDLLKAELATKGIEINVDNVDPNDILKKFDSENGEYHRLLNRINKDLMLVQETLIKQGANMPIGEFIEKRDKKS
ncbi:MAG TPA: hypothetical protein PLB38_00675 [bacterium]|nr:hypothetical protein [bacterium]